MRSVRRIVRGEAHDWVLFVLIVDFVLGDGQLHVSEFGDGKLLRLDVIEIVVNILDSTFFERVHASQYYLKRADGRFRR